MIIYNAKIMTMNAAGDVIENGYIRFENGRITEIGNTQPSPDMLSDGALDADGGVVTPGFIDGHTHIGIIEDSLGFEGDDVNEASDPTTPHMRAVDAINPLERCFSEAREGGVTCVAAGPGSANPIGGQFCAIKTAGKRIDKMIVRAPVAMKFALGENPKGCYHGKNQTPETRMATAALIREQLFKAKKYAEDMDKAHADYEDEDDRPDEPDFDIRSAALVPVVRGSLPAHFHAHRADDIFTAIRISKEFGLKYVIVHCTEGHIIADELAD
ncbi:MAG: amidohydrolase, partial [Eubacteriales bacterium]